MTHKEIQRRLLEDTPFYARNVLKIANKAGKIIPFEFNLGQATLDAKIEAQRAAGKPMRAVILKARQIGFSTAIQAKAIQRCTQRENYNVVVVAHDRGTGEKLFRIGRRMYDHLPDDRTLRPDLGGSRRGREMHFSNGGKRAGTGWPDSTYLVDTAGEFQSGRGGTYLFVHASEVAFWDQIVKKMTGLKNAVPRDPESAFLIESTANGHNAFKDLWEEAVSGESGYLAFFWPWWKEPTYALPFVNEEERAAFRVGDTSQSRFAEGEEKLIDPGPLDTETNEHVPLTLEQLHWRRATIADECSGDFDMFQQEYPTIPEDAFIASARQVFDPTLVRGVMIGTALTDPVNPTSDNPGPWRGQLRAGTVERRKSPFSDNIIAVPKDPLWVPDQELTLGQQSYWKLWEDPKAPRSEQYIIGTDVSGGEIDADRSEPAYHAIEVINHKTHEQVAEYRSRVDPMLLAEQLYLIALMFNMPWLGVEITGGWGLPVIRRLVYEFKYPYVYYQPAPNKRKIKRTDRLGWDTNRMTKPLMEAGMNEALREGNHGIKSRALAGELSTYIRDENGRSKPEAGKYSDLLMAYMQAQQIAEGQPIKRTFATPSATVPRDRVTGW